MANRFSRIMGENHYSYALTNQPIRKEDLYLYKTIIIHSSYRLYQLQSFIENAIVSKTIHIIFVSTNPHSSSFNHLKNQENLLLLDEYKLDNELVLSLRIIEKFSQLMNDLKNKISKMENSLVETKIYYECKLSLMKKGLSENEAHKKIIKYAMDSQISKYEACKRLIEANKS
jgi:hypothetical protein